MAPYLIHCPWAWLPHKRHLARLTLLVSRSVHTTTMFVSSCSYCSVRHILIAADVKPIVSARSLHQNRACLLRVQIFHGLAIAEAYLHRAGSHLVAVHHFAPIDHFLNQPILEPLVLRVTPHLYALSFCERLQEIERLACQEETYFQFYVTLFWARARDLLQRQPCPHFFTCYPIGDIGLGRAQRNRTLQSAALSKSLECNACILLLKLELEQLRIPPRWTEGALDRARSARIATDSHLDICVSVSPRVQIFQIGGRQNSNMQSSPKQ
mmetsp:Transcript_97490/g.183325  ORF Transcript_97490/g.183325 Transcript_97490/m.183325 type:complete len:268 (+) Transcript_97490:237-1040(+)